MKILNQKTKDYSASFFQFDLFPSIFFKKIFFVIVLLLFFGKSSFGQCPAAPIVLTSQADVDNFTATYPGCTNLNHTLQIGPSSDISDLSGLSGVVSVNGLVVTQNDILVNIL